MIVMKPYSCLYFVTYRCNSACNYCNIWRNPELFSTQDALLCDVEDNLFDLKKIGVKFIDFTGGEPLLNKDLPAMTCCAKKLGFFVKVSTNGLLYPNIADQLLDNVDRVYLSLDTTNAEEYHRIRGVDAFNKILESIDIAKELGQEICLLYTVTNDNIKNIEDLSMFCLKNKIMMYVHPCFSYFGNDALSEEFIPIVRKYFLKPYIRMNLPHLQMHCNGGNKIDNPLCRAGRASFDIGPDNSVLVPCFQHQQKKLPINGKLHQLYLSELWNDSFQNAGKYNFCDHCSIECNFGLSYWNRLRESFLLQNLSHLKNMMVFWNLKK